MHQRDLWRLTLRTNSLQPLFPISEGLSKNCKKVGMHCEDILFRYKLFKSALHFLPDHGNAGSLRGIAQILRGQKLRDSYQKRKSSSHLRFATTDKNFLGCMSWAHLRFFHIKGTRSRDRIGIIWQKVLPFGLNKNRCLNFSDEPLIHCRLCHFSS